MARIEIYKDQSMPQGKHKRRKYIQRYQLHLEQIVLLITYEHHEGDKNRKCDESEPSVMTSPLW